MAAREVGLPCQLSVAVAAVTTKPLHKPLRKKPLPAGRPREWWYIPHNRRLKVVCLAIALLDTGVYYPSSADNAKIRTTADPDPLRALTTHSRRTRSLCPRSSGGTGVYTHIRLRNRRRRRWQRPRTPRPCEGPVVHHHSAGVPDFSSPVRAGQGLEGRTHQRLFGRRRQRLQRGVQGRVRRRVVGTQGVRCGGLGDGRRGRLGAVNTDHDGRTTSEMRLGGSRSTTSGRSPPRTPRPAATAH